MVYANRAFDLGLPNSYNPRDKKPGQSSATYNRGLRSPADAAPFFFVPMQYAIFIDAGFLKHKLGSTKVPMGIRHVRSLIETLRKHPDLQEHTLHRVYYYDASPYLGTKENPLSSEKVDFSASPTAIRQTEFLKQVKQEPFFAVRLGELSFEGWQLKPKLLQAPSQSITITKDDICPKISQKGVDMRIGIDMASLTLKRIAQILVLVTGDSDFVPAVKFARREGASIYMVPLGHHIKDSVKEHCDLVLDITPQMLKKSA